MVANARDGGCRMDTFKIGNLRQRRFAALNELIDATADELIVDGLQAQWCLWVPVTHFMALAIAMGIKSCCHYCLGYLRSLSLGCPLRADTSSSLALVYIQAALMQWATGLIMYTASLAYLLIQFDEIPSSPALPALIVESLCRLPGPGSRLCGSGIRTQEQNQQDQA